MSRVRARWLWSAVLLIPAAAGCAAAPPPCVPPCRTPVASTLSDVQLARGNTLVVQLMDGDIVRGTLKDQRPSELDLIVRTPRESSTSRTIAEADIETIARVVGMSKRKRRYLGAAVGALASLPLSISMFGDMVIPGALAGALLGSGRDDVREEIVFDRARPQEVRRSRANRR